VGVKPNLGRRVKTNALRKRSLRKEEKRMDRKENLKEETGLP